MEKESKFGKKTLLAWVKEIFSQNEAALTDIPAEPPEEIVERLIEKASGKQSAEQLPKSEDTSQEKESKSSENENPTAKKDCCPYAVKRNIVESLQEIRRFAEKHHLAATIVRAILTLLAEMAIGAMKGKVGEKALETLLRAFNYQQHIEEAYIRGKNETIVREYFPEAEDIPHLGGMQREDPDPDNIFSMARQA